MLPKLPSSIRHFKFCYFFTEAQILLLSSKKLTVFDQVKAELQKDYMETREVNEDNEWPPNQPRTIVNVALIHYKGRRTQQELIEISSRHKVGTDAVDELVGKKSRKYDGRITVGKSAGRSIAAHTSHTGITKTIGDVFAANPDSSDKCNAPPKHVLIEGAPGIGKTVFAKEVAYLWAKKRLLEKVDILFLLFLRDPSLQTVESDSQFVQYIIKSVGNVTLNDEQVERLVEQLKSVQVCLVLDGYDEYPANLYGKSFIAKIIKGKIFSNAIVVVTSRPTATVHLHDLVDRRIEILGFAQKERDEYITSSLKDSVAE